VTVLVDKQTIANGDASVRPSAEGLDHFSQEFRRHGVIAGSDMQKLTGCEI
jgi:hypothetical protein